MNKLDKKYIYDSFVDGTLLVQSVSKDKRTEWKRVTDVTKHDVMHKDQYKVTLEDNSSCIATGDHSFFVDDLDAIKEMKTGNIIPGDMLVCVEEEVVTPKRVASVFYLSPMQYMYDLSVEDNQNFVLKSGILAHNTFRPPSHEKFLQAQAQVFGYIWEDEELYEFLQMAVEDYNSAPPVTGITLFNMPDRWSTLIVLRAGAFALMAITANWIANEFSYSISGISLDLEKSSKYESLKNNFIAEYDKAKDLAKQSIKIMKGLKQPRYGIGISSALGPYSRPGVQSRRNFISGFGGGWS